MADLKKFDLKELLEIMQFSNLDENEAVDAFIAELGLIPPPENMIDQSERIIEQIDAYIQSLSGTHNSSVNINSVEEDASYTGYILNAIAASVSYATGVIKSLVNEKVNGDLPNHIIVVLGGDELDGVVLREGANKWIAPSPRTLCPHLKCPSLQKPDFCRKYSAIKRHLASFSRLISIFGRSYPMSVSSGPRETDSPA